MKKKPPPKKQPQSKPASQLTNIASQQKVTSYKVVPAIIIAIVAFVLYAQSTLHNYALDDSAVIQENSVITQGFAGISTVLKTDYWCGFRSQHIERAHLSAYVTDCFCYCLGTLPGQSSHVPFC